MEIVENSADKRKSFGFSLGDERINLIDMLSEDDGFLVTSPFSDSLDQNCFSGVQGGSRLSGFGNFQEIMEQPHPRRPSFMRKSLAWDSAFLNSAGVLDPEELSVINKGFRKTEARPLPPGTQGARKRRPEVESNPDKSLDWFEFELFEKRKPPIYKPNNGESCDNVTRGNLRRGLTKGGKIKSNETCTRKSIYLTSREIMTKEAAQRERSGKRVIPSPKPPKASDRSINRKDLSGKSNLKLETKSAITGSGTEKRLFHQRSPNTSIILPPTSIVSVSSCKTPQTSSFFLKQKTEHRKSKLSTSVSSWRDSDRNKVNGNQNNPTDSPASCSTYSSAKSFFSSSSLDCKKQISSVSKVRLDSEMKIPSPLLLTHENNVSRSPKQYSSHATSQTRIGSFSTDTIRPSKLRQPSVTIGFFDEKKASSSQEVTSREVPNGEGISFVSRSKKISNSRKTIYGNLDTPRKSEAKRPRNKIAMNLSFEEEKRRGLLKNKRCKGNSSSAPVEVNNLYTSVDQIGNLSKYFETMALDQQNRKMKFEQKREKTNMRRNEKSPFIISSHLEDVASSMRTPLADKSSVSNFSNIFPLVLGQKKEKVCM